jgi:hypothetical protein
MPTSFDGQILRFDDDLHVEARTVLSHTAEPQNAFEVAVILETLGHTDATARGRGYEDIFDLARHLYETLEDVRPRGVRPVSSGTGPELAPNEWTTSVPRAAALWIGQSLPWLTTLIVLLVTGTGFWSSTVFTPEQSAAVLIALAAGLIVSALFSFPFARRATFYRLQGNLTLVGWTARWVLGTGAVASVAVMGVLYVLIERVLQLYTPGDTRMLFEIGVAVALLQLAFAPLYTMRAFGWLAAATVVGVAVLGIGLARVDHGALTDPFSVVVVQLSAMAAMTTVAVAGSWWLLRRRGAKARVPSKWALVRSTAPYAVYGAGFFLLVLVGGFTAGGIFRGHFEYIQTYNVVTGGGLFVLLPLFGYMSFTGERLSVHVGSLVKSVAVTEIEKAASNMRRRLHRDLANLVIVGLAAGVVMIGVVGLLASRIGPAALIWSHLALFAIAVLSYVALGAGMLASQILFVLSRPAATARGVAGGFVFALGTAAPLSLVWSGSAAALFGLACGTLLFAAITVWSTDHDLRRFDRVYYGAL